jgi:hypothetical protein
MPCYCDSVFHPNDECQNRNGRGVNSGPYSLLDSKGSEIMTGTLSECQLWRMRKGTDCRIVATTVGK